MRARLLRGGKGDGRRWPVDSRGALLAFTVLVALQVVASTVAARDPLAFVAVLLFLVAIVVSFRSTLSGLVLIVLAQLYVLRGTAEISVGELAYAAVFASTLLGWAARDARTVEGRRLLRSPVGSALVLFLSLCVLSIVLVVLYGGSPMWWFRDLVRFSYLLLFFPVAAAVRNRRDALVVLGCLAAVILYHGILTITWYAEAVSSTRALWQLKYQRVALHEIFAMTTLVASLGAFLKARTRAVSLGAVVMGFIGLIALGVSFTRGYWLAAALACVLAAVMLKGPGRRVLAFGAVLVVAGLAGGVAVFSAKFIGVLISMADRISTFTSPLRVLSVQERMAETRAVLALIASSPVLGRGLGTEVSYMSPLLGHVIRRPFLHNAYLFVWLKTGLVGLVAFLVFYLRGVRMTARAAYGSSDPLVRGLLMSGAAVLIAAIPLSFTSPQFYDKSSALVLALVLGLSYAALRGRLDTGERRHGGTIPGGADAE